MTTLVSFCTGIPSRSSDNLLPTCSMSADPVNIILRKPGPETSQEARTSPASSASTTFSAISRGLERSSFATFSSPLAWRSARSDRRTCGSASWCSGGSVRAIAAVNRAATSETSGRTEAMSLPNRCETTL